jgi:NAD(P)-dependent dehydrogenase (short-subunit alcohol dehydrogenase family)
MDLQLRGKTVLITGASKGIGWASAEAFAAEGCHLHLTARNADALAELVALLDEKYHAKATAHPIDMGESAQRAALCAAVPNIDILVNNAGDIPSGPLHAVSEDAWRSGWEVKVFGYIALMRHYYPLMKARGGGVIINDIGNSGQHFDVNYLAGSAGNASLMAVTRALGGASLDDNIRVVGVNPGPVATDRMVKIMKRRAQDLHGNESRWQELFERYPGGRPAKPEEVADLIVFLASPRAAYITGTIVTIDGGIASRDSIIPPRQTVSA